MCSISAERAFAMADAYRLIGILLQLPDASIAQGIESGAMQEDLAAILSEIDSTQNAATGPLRHLDERKAAQTVTLTDLRRDYTKLFTNPEHPCVPIYESTYKQTGDFDTSALVFVSPTALDAERIYRESRLAVDNTKHDSPDHMGAEVDYLCALYYRMGEHASNGDAEQAAAAHVQKDAFCTTHFLKWAHGFFSLVEENASTPVYRTIGALGSYLAETEQRCIRKAS